MNACVGCLSRCDTVRLLIFVGWPSFAEASEGGLPPCMEASCPHGLGSDIGAGLPLRPSTTLSCVGRLARFLTAAALPGVLAKN
jgi:hypothetical protein